MKSRSNLKEDEFMSKGKLPLSYSPSSSCHKKGRLSQVVEQIYEKNEIGCWLGNKFEGEEEDNEIGEAKIEAIDDEEAKQQREGDGIVVIEKQHMFDKVVTPSDVGKLNRLVIPKQHAEKYFPLDSSTNEKGLLLNFEDKNGKEWRFRYSYWNSSQSYVMTKGWSRFVKEKKLDAGDIVSFQRGVGRDRLYIDWRRRPDAMDPITSHHHHHHHFSSSPWSPLLMRPPATSVPLLLSRDHLHLSSNPNANNLSYGFTFGTNYNNVVNPSSVFYVRSLVPNSQHQQVGSGMVQWQQQGAAGEAAAPTMVYESVPVVQGKASAKRLRLFGVNMDCPIATNDQSHHQCQPDNFSSITTSIQPRHSAISLQPTQGLPHSQLPPQFRLYNGTPLQVMPSPQYLHNDNSSMSLDLEI